MNIFYISYIRFPSERAHAIQVAQMCNAFTECGHATTLLTTSRKKEVTHTFEEYFGVMQRFVHNTIWIPEWAVNASIFTKLWQIYFAFCCVFYLLRKHADLVYSRDEWVLFILSFCLPRKRLAWESHEAKWNRASRRLFSKGVSCVVISEGIYDAYIKKGVNKNLLILEHDAVDANFFAEKYSQQTARKHLGIEGSGKVVLYIGGLDQWKGVDVLCKSASLFQDKASLYIIGGRPEQIESYRRCYPNVAFLGFYTYAQLPLNQQAADVLVIPNTSKNESSSSFTSPLKLYTYMASGVPIVASDVPSIRSVLGCGSCVYFTPDNPESLSNAIHAVLDRPEEAKEFAMRAGQLVQNKTWTNRASTILKSVVAEQ